MALLNVPPPSRGIAETPLPCTYRKALLPLGPPPLVPTATDPSKDVPRFAMPLVVSPALSSGIRLPVPVRSNRAARFTTCAGGAAVLVTPYRIEPSAEIALAPEGWKEFGGTGRGRVASPLVVTRTATRD